MAIFIHYKGIITCVAYILEFYSTKLPFHSFIYFTIKILFKVFNCQGIESRSSKRNYIKTFSFLMLV